MASTMSRMVHKVPMSTAFQNTEETEERQGTGQRGDERIVEPRPCSVLAAASGWGGPVAALSWELLVCLGTVQIGLPDKI